MRKNHIIFAISMVLLTCNANIAHSQDSPSIKNQHRDQAAVVLLRAAYMRMLNGLTNAPSDVEISGVTGLTGASSPGGQFEAKLSGRDFVVRTTIGAHRNKYVVHKDHGFFVRDGKEYPLHDHTAHGYTSGLFPIFDRWSAFLSPQVSVIDEGIVIEQGTSCHLIHVNDLDAPQGNSTPLDLKTFNHHGSVDVFLNNATGDLYAVRFHSSQASLPHLETPIEWVYGGYEKLSGLWIPTQIYEYHNGTNAITTTIQKISINGGLISGDFSEHEN